MESIMGFLLFALGLAIMGTFVHEMVMTENLVGLVAGIFLPPVGFVWGLYDLITTPFSLY